MDNEEILKRYRKLSQDRQIVQDTWDEIERYIAPYRGRFFKDERSESSVEWRRPFIYDGTAVMASQSLAAYLHSALTSPKIRWFDLKFESAELQDNTEAVEWLDVVSMRMYKALQESNFTVEAGETYQDIVDFGTSIITEEAASEDAWDGIDFKSVPLKEGYFEQDDKGNVKNFYRHIQWTPIQIVSKFGLDNVPQWVIDKAEGAETANQKEDLIFCIFARDKSEIGDVNVFKPLAPLARPYGYKYVTLKAAETIGGESGYYEMPAFIPRWRTTSSSMWGNSPAMIALSDVLTLNRLVELHIQAMEKVIDPAILTTERGLMGDLDLNPGGLSVLRDINEIRPFESGARFDVNYQEITRYRDQIREYFMIDQLLLPPMEGTPATATEISARISQLERLIGSTLGRLQADFLDPLIKRTFNILFRGGQLPEPPQAIMEAGASLDVEYVGPLVRSQEQDQVNAVERWLLQLTNISQIAPEVLDVVDWDKMSKGVADMLGVPAKFVKTEAEIKKVRDERAAQAKAVNDAEVAKMEGEAMKAVGEGEAAMNATGTTGAVQ